MRQVQRKGELEMSNEMLAVIALCCMLAILCLILSIELHGYKKQAHSLSCKLMDKIIACEESNRKIDELRQRLWLRGDVDTTKYAGYDLRD